MKIPLEMGGINHKGATQYESDIDEYIQWEIQAGVTIGPFDCLPFKSAVGVSPLSSRAKKDSDKRQIILDCSWPIGTSLNDGMDKNKYLGQLCELKYPTIDSVTRKIFDMSRKEQAEKIFLYKEDLNAAFQQLFADPISVPLLGYRWRGLYYFDLVMVMGCRIAPYICQRTTNMITYLQKEMEYFLINYVDDFLGIEYESKVWEAHAAFIRLLDSLKIGRLVKKSVPPLQTVEFIGNLVDAESMTIGVTPGRKIEVLKELEAWKQKKSCTRRQLESLIGKLQFMSNCIKPGRLFISRLLNFMKGLKRDKYYYLDEEIRKDIKWWYCFSQAFKAQLSCGY